MAEKQPGLLIAFDGLDSSGKNTQVGRLTDRLRYMGRTVERFQTPDYTTPSGQELKARLQGKMGDWADFPWEKKMHLFATNRAEHREEVNNTIQQGNIVMYDRYVPSSLAFIAVEALQTQEAELYREKIHQSVEKLEYYANHMPRESVSIFLDVPPRISASLLEKRKEKLKDEDEYTDHIHVQERLYNEYDVLCREQPNRFLRITCVQNGEMLNVDAVSELVWEGLLSRFPHLHSTKQ